MICLGCGYKLQGLPKRVCPECSRVFDPNDASTYGLPGARGVAKRVWVLGAYPLAAFSLSSAVALFGGDLSWLWVAAVLSLPIGLIGVVAYAVDCWSTHPRAVGVIGGLWIAALLLLIVDPAGVWKTFID